MSSQDLSSLATKVSKDKGYSSSSPTEGGLRGFVCPRANAYGGRDGIIPPGVAAQRGLVPRGMRKISVADTAKTATAAADGDKSEAELYMDYYGSGEGARKAEEPVRAPTAQPKKQATVRAETEVVSDNMLGEPAPRMFSAPEKQAGGEDTLDGFYDSLPSPNTGTRPRRRQERQAIMGVDYGRNAESVTAEVRHTERGLELAGLQKMADDEAGLRRRVAELTEERDAAKASALSARMEADELKSKLSFSHPVRYETVRVTLSAEEEKIKIGGEGWECRIMGSLSYSRTGGTVTLTIADTSYSSELLAEIRPGQVVIVSAKGRTSCHYSGVCAKLYGESGSADYIALFGFSCEDGESKA